MKRGLLFGVLGVLGIAVTGITFWVYELHKNGTTVREMLEYQYRMATEESDDKPVIYLYSDIDNKPVRVWIGTEHEITCVYPKQDSNDAWQVYANKDSRICDQSGKEYNYLFWEGLSDMSCDYSKGFCVKGEDSIGFCEDSLSKLGLTCREANEFIVYWLPKLEKNKYNLISFQTDCYTNAYDLHVEPAPDNMLRVFMAFKPLEEVIDMKAQDLDELRGSFKREGFYVVEWGGREEKR